MVRTDQPRTLDGHGSPCKASWIITSSFCCYHISTADLVKTSKDRESVYAHQVKQSKQIIISNFISVEAAGYKDHELNN